MTLAEGISRLLDREANCKRLEAERDRARYAHQVAVNEVLAAYDDLRPLLKPNQAVLYDGTAVTMSIDGSILLLPVIHALAELPTATPSEDPS